MAFGRHGPFQKGLDEHAGTQFLLGVGDFGPDQKGPRFLAEGRIGKIHFSLMWIAFAVGQLQLHLVGLILGQGEPSLSDFLPERSPLVLGDGKIYPDGIQLGHISKLEVVPEGER